MSSRVRPSAYLECRIELDASIAAWLPSCGRKPRPCRECAGASGSRSSIWRSPPSLCAIDCHLTWGSTLCGILRDYPRRSGVSSISCPYCEKDLADGGSEKCEHCGKVFPWAQQFARVQDELKSREPNRLRATLTLVEEIVGQARGVRPLSLAAIKGFVAAWMFPRTVIVLGSLLGALVLFAQTALIYRQNSLMEVQVRAYAYEQEARIRDRMPRLSSPCTGGRTSGMQSRCQ
jgi:hypothetical protein